MENLSENLVHGLRAIARWIFGITRAFLTHECGAKHCGGYAAFRKEIYIRSPFATQEF